ncbi:MAG: hypothetical protein GWP14_07215 [Actinobacteria bacterium]|nr:hypothetical protein [Actinomycetota bacterium]
MGSRKVLRIAAGVILACGLAVLLSVPAQAQDTQQNEETLSWYQKLTSSEGLQEQFQSNPILFFTAVFALGIGTSLTPCVLPMIPITVSIISGSKQETSGHSTARNILTGLTSSLLYVLGMSLTYALLGILAALVGFRLRSLLQGWAVQAAIGGLFVVLGLSMVGLFSLPIPGWGRGTLDTVAQRHKAKRSLLTVFVLGLVSGIIASPCVAPVIGALLLWVSTAGLWLGWWVLFVFGWGMGLLLIVLGVSGWVISSGKWMLTVKTVLGLVLVLSGAWIIIQGIRAQPLIPINWL